MLLVQHGAIASVHAALGGQRLLLPPAFAGGGVRHDAGHLCRAHRWARALQIVLTGCSTRSPIPANPLVEFEA
jgi:hypothetical protein